MPTQELRPLLSRLAAKTSVAGRYKRSFCGGKPKSESSHLITLSAEPPSENLQCVEIIFRHTDARRRVHRGKSIIGERKLLFDLCQKLAWTEWFRYIVGTSCFPCDDVISA